MIRQVFTFLCSLFLLAGSLEATLWEKIQSTFGKSQQSIPTIKVLVVDKADGVILEVKGRYNIYDPFTQGKIASRFSGKSKLIQPVQGGLKWGEEFPGIYQIQIVPDEQSITTIVDGKEYKGKIYVYDVNGLISIVNEVNLEDYLNSILGHQFNQPYAPEAMAAIAIIERTNALYQALNSTNTYWHVRAQDVDYEGYAVTGRNNGVDKAVGSTKYMVMSRNGSLFPASWAKNEESQANRMPVLSIEQAEKMAIRGNHAAEILSKAFPNASIQLSYNQPGEN